MNYWSVYCPRKRLKRAEKAFLPFLHDYGKKSSKICLVLSIWWGDLKCWPATLHVSATSSRYILLSVISTNKRGMKRRLLQDGRLVFPREVVKTALQLQQHVEHNCCVSKCCYSLLIRSVLIWKNFSCKAEMRPYTVRSYTGSGWWTVETLSDQTRIHDNQP